MPKTYLVSLSALFASFLVLVGCSDTPGQQQGSPNFNTCTGSGCNAPKSIYGDFNDDGVINDDDYQMLNKAFESTSGNRGYVARIDFDEDGKIDLNDFKAFSMVYDIKIKYADFDRDGDVDQADYFIFRAGFGKSVGQASYSVLLDSDADGLIGVVEFGLFRLRFTPGGPAYGDLNNDGVVGIADFGLFRSTFGKSAGQIGYLAAADFDGDDHIGEIDFDAFRAVFGK